ncbi:MAG TPA: HEAT repeat domain-containing protein, partial [Planctomycetota bacterium]|nr:HEAT repeat domain-containing protein [Planctomycetota bacterium]
MSAPSRILAATALACALVLVLLGLPRGLESDGSGAPAESRVRALLERSDSDPKFALSGLESALVELGDAAAPALEEALDPARERSDAAAIARALARLRKEGALPALLRLARSERAEARLAAVSGLACVGAKAAVAPLLDRLADESVEVASAAVERLVELDRSAPKLQVRADVARLFDRGRCLAARVRAADCLVRIGGPESVSLLERALRDLDADVRAASADGLGRLGSAGEDARAELVEM